MLAEIVDDDDVGMGQPASRGGFVAETCDQIGFADVRQGLDGDQTPDGGIVSAVDAAKAATP